jgi:hypothetical protein
MYHKDFERSQGRKCHAVTRRYLQAQEINRNVRLQKPNFQTTGCSLIFKSSKDCVGQIQYKEVQNYVLFHELSERGELLFVQLLFCCCTTRYLDDNR